VVPTKSLLSPRTYLFAWFPAPTRVDPTDDCTIPLRYKVVLEVEGCQTTDILYQVLVDGTNHVVAVSPL
jgi:hypothetical protein